jgi:hypothetical protein
MDTPQTPWSTKIKVRHGVVEEVIEIEPFGLLESEIKQQLKFSNEMVTFCRIEGLRDISTNQIVKFRTDELNTACIDASKLKEGT